MISIFPPGSRRINQDIISLKNSLDPWNDLLIPWVPSEYALLSYNAVEQKVNRGFSKKGKGILTSIYHEPMVSYAFKTYFGHPTKLILARTSKDDYLYRMRTKDIQLAVDKYALGRLEKDGTLFNPRKKKIGYISLHHHQGMHAIFVGRKEVGTLSVRTDDGSYNPRAFEFVSDMDKEEETIFTGLVLYLMIKDFLP